MSREAELVKVAEFLALLKFRSRLQPMPELDEAQLATLYAACADEDRALAKAGMADYVHKLCQGDVP